MEDIIKNIKKQHVDNYRNAILENIKNNTKVLIQEDIMSLIRKPPLDSMDSIKVKFLDLAKRNKIVLNTDELSKMVDKYRDDLSKCCKDMHSIRENDLIEKVNSYSLEKDSDVIKINKKDFTDINKKMKKMIKEQLVLSLDKRIISNMDRIFSKEVDEILKKKIQTDIVKFMKGQYQRQLLENFDIKVLVKDTTLINGVKEQTERYLFTLSNSRLLSEELISS